MGLCRESIPKKTRRAEKELLMPDKQRITSAHPRYKDASMRGYTTITTYLAGNYYFVTSPLACLLGASFYIAALSRQKKYAPRQERVCRRQA